MSKICHVTSVHNRYDIRILKKECCSLARAGHDVYLLCIDEKEDEIFEGVKIISVKKKFKNRIQRIIKSWKVLITKALQIDAEIYHLHDPELLKLGIKLKEQGKKIIFDSHEDVPASIKEKDWLPMFMRNLAAKLYEKKEKKAFIKFDGLITVTPHIYDRLAKINSKTATITNFPLLTEQSEGDDKQTNVCFAGGISAQWMHENVIRAISKFGGRIKYVLMGDINSDYFKKLQQMQGFENVIVYGKVSHSEVASIFCKCMAGIALNDYVANVGFHKGSIGNTKLFEYMNSGLPIICTDFELWKNIVEDNHIGICVNPHDIGQIENALEYLLKNTEQSIEMGKKARILAETKYNWQTQIPILLNFYENL